MINKKETLLFSILNKNGENLNQEEKDFLQKIKEDDLLLKELEEYLNLEYFLLNTPKAKEFDTDKSWAAFSKKVSESPDATLPRKKNLINIRIIAAACLAAIITTGALSYLFSTNKNSNSNTSNSQLVFDTGNKKIVVDNLADIVSDTLKIGNYSNAIITTQNEISFINNSNNEIEEILLSVPKGKKYKLVLSDGSKVTLNGDTEFIFPSTFKSERSVNLKGEAFFEIAHDSLHPFNVFTDRLKTTVLGTKFNVSAYPENTFNAFISSRQSLIVSKADVHSATAWLRGALVFKDQSFRHIAKILERNYNTRIEITNEKIKNSRFTGYFKEESLLDILEIFKTTTNFKYQIKNNHVIIK